jgi:cholesterol oxidase
MRFTGAALTVVAELLRDRSVVVERKQRWLRRMRDLVTVDSKGALSHSFMYKLDGQDSNRGVANLGNGGAAIDWADYANDPLMKFAEERLEQWARKVGGTVVPNVAKLPGMRSFSVHPLGGCRIGTDVGDGVVDAVGRVFRPDGGVYEGLRIADGSVIRNSLGVPPSFTISAVAERVAASIAAAA